MANLGLRPIEPVVENIGILVITIEQQNLGSQGTVGAAGPGRWEGPEHRQEPDAGIRS